MGQLKLWLQNLMLIGLFSIPYGSSQYFTDRTIQIVGKNFLLGGKEFHIISGEFHYFRTPAASWRDILTKLKVAGLNTVSTYVEWSFHEPEEREYDFSGDRDVAQFIRTAAEVGLYVLLRPGPYICAERDLGGFPYWLLGKYPRIKLRSLDRDFMSETTTWFHNLFVQLSPLLYGNGGPIILVQVENEIGAYNNDQKYMRGLSELLRKFVRSNAILYTTDSASKYQKGFLTSRSLAAIKYGPGSKVSEVFREVKKSGGPLMNAELYTGNFSKWSEPMASVDDTNFLIKILTESLDSGVHVNFYMFFGGTNFGFTSGAVSSNDQKAFTPILTSYDYEAPLDEAGNPTDKYFAIRKVLVKYFPDVKSLPPPVVKDLGSYGKVLMKPTIGLLSEEGRAMLASNSTTYSGDQLPTFEELRQRSGLVLYELNVSSRQLKEKYGQSFNSKDKILYIKKPKDSITVFVNGVKSGNIRRMNSQHRAKIVADDDFTLSLLVENQGRNHYMEMDENNNKGILSKVKLNNATLQGNWIVTRFNLENIIFSDLKDFETKNSASLNTTRGPVLYTGTMKLLQTPLNTFLNTRGWGMGVAWVNGHNLGRYWPAVGPQLTLFVPGVWLNTAPEMNVIHMLELEQPSKHLTIEFVSYPMYKNITKNVTPIENTTNLQ